MARHGGAAYRTVKTLAVPSFHGVTVEPRAITGEGFELGADADRRSRAGRPRRDRTGEFSRSNERHAIPTDEPPTSSRAG